MTGTQASRLQRHIQSKTANSNEEQYAKNRHSNPSRHFTRRRATNNQYAERAYRRRLCARGKMDGLQHEPFGISRRRAAGVAGGRTLLVSRHHTGRDLVCDGGKREWHESSGFRSSEGSGRAFGGSGAEFDAHHLPFTEFEFSPDGQTISFSAQRRRWKCDLAADKCSPDGAAPATGVGAGGRGGAGNSVTSPEKKRAAFIRNYNLWVRDVATGKETQLTKDGVKDFGYATDNAGWTKSDRPVLVWSPDSKKIATFQHDSVAWARCIWSTRGSAIRTWRHGNIRFPATQNFHDRTRHHRCRQDARHPPEDACRIRIALRSATTFCARGSWPMFSGSRWRLMAFVSTSRDHKHEQLRVADAATGQVRDVLQESVETYFESGNGRELAFSSRLKRSDLVFRARQLGAALSLRPTTGG